MHKHTNPRLMREEFRWHGGDEGFIAGIWILLYLAIIGLAMNAPSALTAMQVASQN